MKKKLLLFVVMIMALSCIFAITASAARVENYEDKYTLANDTQIIHYYTWTYLDADGVTEKTVNRGYTDNITVEFLDEDGNPLTEVPLWEYDTEDCKYYSLVWYISDWEYVSVDTEIQDNTAGTQTRPVYKSAVYTLTKVRAVNLKFYDRDWRGNILDQAIENPTFTINGTEWAHSGEDMKALEGIYLDVNNTPDDKTDDLRLNHPAGFSRYQDGAKYGDYEGQFAHQGNKIVVANLRDCDIQKDVYENYGASSTWAGATHLQYLAYPDTFLYMCGGIGNVWEIDLGESIEVINCQILRDSKKVETLVLPNSLLYIGNESFRGSTCKNLVIGEGLLYAPTNVNLWKSCSFEKVYVSKNILTTYQGYITKHEGNGSSILSYTTDIFFDGNLEQATALMEKMIAENSGNDGKITLLDYNTNKDRGTLKNTVIFYNYNRCEAFYRGHHNAGTVTTCIVNEDLLCSRCPVVIIEAGKFTTHNLSKTYSYPMGFAKNGVYTCECQNASYCTDANIEVGSPESVLDPIITPNGISLKVEGTAVSVTAGFLIDNDALDYYNGLLTNDGKESLNVGLFIANSTQFGEATGFVNAEGELQTTKGFQVSIENGYSVINSAVRNFKATEQNKTLALIYAIYVVDNGDVSYVSVDNSVGTEATVGTEKINAITIMHLDGVGDVYLPDSFKE